MRFRLIKTRRALEYIRNGLQGGCSLSRALLRRLERATVRIGAWLPSDTPKSKIYRFEQGGILPPLWEEAIHLPSGGVLVPVPTTVSIVRHYLYRHLNDCKKKACQWFLLAPDELASPSDPWIARYQSPEGTGLLFWGDEVYHYAKADAPLASVEWVIRQASSLAGMFSYVVLSHGDVALIHSPEVVASSVDLFVVRAYDGESFLLVKFVDSC
jgi:hypothetical protein